MRLPEQILRTLRPKPQVRFGTVTSVATGICTVQVAGGEIPAITMNGAAIQVGDFVAVQRQSVASYVLNPASGAIWLAARGNGIDEQLAWRVTTGGQQSGFDLGPYYLGNYPNAVAVHPNRSVWVGGTASLTNDAPGAVWRIAPVSGAVVTTTVVPAAYPSAGVVWGLCVGPDGNIWATGEGTSNLLCSLSPTTGALLSTTSAPTYGAATGQMVAGPDGNLWMTDANLPGVWSYDISTGTWRSLTMPLADPVGITAHGSHLYVSDNYGAIWVVTPPDGTAYYELPSPIDGIPVTPEQIVVDGSGAVWFTDASPRVLKFVIGQGATAYNTTTTPSPDFLGLCFGPDGNLWACGSSGEGATTALVGFNLSGQQIGSVIVQAPPGYAEPNVGYQIATGP